jgi:hypothetical protein
MSLINFPDVPQLAGVPALVRSNVVSNPVAKGALGALEGSLWRSLNTQEDWGVFDKTGKIKLIDIEVKYPIIQNLYAGQVATDSVEYTKEMNVSEFPIEGGGFESYNKVEKSANSRVTIIVSGSETDRTKALNLVDAATKSMTGYSIVTPEITYKNYSIIGYNYSRSGGSGATMLKIELTLKEERSVTAELTSVSVSTINAKSPDATPVVKIGKITTVDTSSKNTSYLLDAMKLFKGYFK